MGEAELTERVEYNPKYHLTEAEVSDIADQEGLDRSKIPRLPWVGSKTGERVLKRLDLGPAFHEYPESPKGLTLDRYFTTVSALAEKLETEETIEGASLFDLLKNSNIPLRDTNKRPSVFI